MAWLHRGTDLMQMYIRVIDGKPAGSPQSNPLDGSWVKYTPFTGDFDDDRMQLVDTSTAIQIASYRASLSGPIRLLKFSKQCVKSAINCS